jgi:amino acid transporter
MPGRRTNPRGAAAAGKHGRLDVLGGLAALGLDALSSVAYGPEAMMLVLITAGTGALHAALPLTLVIAGMLGLLVVSYSQVIAAHPDGGGAYAVAKQDLGRRISLLAAASLVVDYVLTVAVSLAAGAASLGSAFPSLAHHLLLVSLAALVVLTVINLYGLAESAKVLMLPTALFIGSVLAVIAVGLARSPHPVAVIGTNLGPFRATETLGILLMLKAFAAGCSAVTGVEAIANGVPEFRSVRSAQRTEFALGGLLATMLIGLAVLIRVDHVVPRGGVTVLAQLTAGAFGTGWAFYVSNVAVAVVLAAAANTSFGGLPVLMNLLGQDGRLPHLFSIRAAKPIYRHGIVFLALLAGLLLVAVGAETNRLIPLFTIGVFTGFTISQVGLVRHWRKQRSPHWRARAALNAAGAVVTAIAVVVFVVTKFVEGAWVVIVAVPLLIVLFARIEGYYAEVADELKLGETPPVPRPTQSLVIVPTSTVNLLSERVLSAGLSLSDNVVAVAVAGDDEQRAEIERDWARWHCEIPLKTIVDPNRSLVRSVLHYVDSIPKDGTTIVVLIPEIEPRKPWHEILHNQRGQLLAAVLRSQTDVIVATLPFRLHD